jgi:hypothetical protein
MKLIIAGGRNFTNYKQLVQECNQFLIGQATIEIVSGAYFKGADLLGEKYAKEREYKLTKFPADWNKYGKSAGPKRNQQMANYADALIAFWDGKSRGTKHMIEMAKQSKLRMIILVIKSNR